MSVHSLQTPFPTLLTQGQVYKLPSSRPQDTPGLLSPVPIVSQITLTSSNKLTENQYRSSRSANGNKSWHRPKYGDSSKTLSSMTLASGTFSPDEVSGPALYGRSYKQDRSRSTSRSSSNSSAISITLKDSQKYHSTLKHSQSLTSLKADGKMKKKQKQKQKSSKNKRSIVPLASPFVSRSSSPAKACLDERRNAHIYGKNYPNLTNQAPEYGSMGPPPVPNHGTDASSKEPKSNMRAGLSDTFFDSNLPVRQHGNAFGRTPQRGAKPSPRKMAKSLSRLQRGNVVSISKTKSQLDFGIDALVPALEEVRKVQKHRKAEEKRKVAYAYERQRRTSAPSSLQLPRMQRNFTVGHGVPLTVDGARSVEGGLAEPQKIRLGTGLDIVLDPRSYYARAVISSDEAANNGPKKPRSESSSLEWMHARGGIDFNRPPSQMSFDSGYGFEYPDIEATDVFSSSEEDVDSEGGARREEGAEHGSMQDFTRGRAPIATVRDAHRLGVPFSFKLSSAVLDFGEDVWAASTPFKNVPFDIGSKTNGKPRARLNLSDNGYENDLNVVANVKKRRLEQEKQTSNEHGSAPLSLTRAFSLPNLKSSPDSLRTSSSLGLGSTADIGSKKKSAPRGSKERAADDDEDGERDMDLTGSKIQPIALGVEARRESNAEIGQGMTSWITDSIISPPTGYVQWAIKKGEDVTNSDGGRDVGSSQGLEGTHRHHKDRLLGQLPGLMDTGKKEEGIVVEENTSGRPNLETQEQMAAQRDQRKRGLFKEPSEERATSAGPEHAHGSANIMRTRSGTIVLISAPIPPGTRRTRGGTIVGPLPVAAPTNPLPSIPIGNSGIGHDSGVIPDVGTAIRRSRSGTITATGSVGMADERTRGGSVQRSKGKAAPSFLDDDHVVLNQRQRFGDAVHNRHNDTEQVLGIEVSANEVEETQIVEEECEADIECYMDSMYLPALTSSPDPIDFLRFASIEEEEEDNIGFTEFGLALGGIGAREIAWRVAEDPSSPEMVKKRGNGIFRGIDFGGGKGWSLTGKTGGRKPKAQYKKAKFAEGLAGGEDADEEEIGRNGDTEMSDDELLLLPGTMGDFGLLR
ncbi:hypothetical protein CVT25_002541 [Psilocybe cyanescens]|uniref:Uncharacterized protein n=1 Tax=Psilocybe cyanescens TaxID=93625 RepID=A0A409XUP5_PSICY|nr:hypothetical protein CVT25_002541 [Psilocybe cyanescens]